MIVINSIVVGIIFGTLTSSAKKIGLFFIGIWMGWILDYLLFIATIYYVNKEQREVKEKIILKE